MISDPAGVRHSIQGGFSLLEVLVAFVILAMSLGVLMQIFSMGARSAVLGEHYSRAAELAESTLALAGVEYPVQPGVHEGEQAGYGWRLEITPYLPENLQAPPPQWLPYQVSVRVVWTDTDQERSLELSTLRLQRFRQ